MYDFNRVIISSLTAIAICIPLNFYFTTHVPSMLPGSGITPLAITYFIEFGYCYLINRLIDSALKVWMIEDE